MWNSCKCKWHYRGVKEWSHIVITVNYTSVQKVRVVSYIGMLNCNCHGQESRSIKAAGFFSYLHMTKIRLWLKYAERTKKIKSDIERNFSYFSLKKPLLRTIFGWKNFLLSGTLLLHCTHLLCT